MATVSPDCVTLVRTDQTELTSRAGTFLIRLNVNATSAAVIGVPSLKVTFLAMVNVSVWLLLLQA